MQSNQHNNSNMQRQGGSKEPVLIQGDFRKVSGISSEIFRQIEAVENDHDPSTAAALDVIIRVYAITFKSSLFSCLFEIFFVSSLNFVFCIFILFWRRKTRNEYLIRQNFVFSFLLHSFHYTKKII
jgi:hypothetical protein